MASDGAQAPAQPNQPMGTTAKLSSGSRRLGMPVIKVLGIGGAGCNAVNRMCQERVEGVEYYGINTDALHLSRCDISNKVPMGQAVTRGLGAGGDPEVGRQAAAESRDELAQIVAGADLLFLAAGMGGGTGTGSCPLIARLAKEAGALTVAVVSRPFSFEIARRRQYADAGIAQLKNAVDTMLVIPNDKLLEISDQSEQPMTWDEAMVMADSVLQQGIQAITEVVTVPGEINVDFADVKAVLQGAGQAWLAIGTGIGENRAADAATNAINSPLLDMEIEDVKRLLFVVTGGPSLTLNELHMAANVIEGIANPDANVIFGTVKDSRMVDEVKVTLVAAAFPIPEQGEEIERLQTSGPMSSMPEAPRVVSNDLDVPSFLRRAPTQRSRGPR